MKHASLQTKATKLHDILRPWAGIPFGKPYLIHPATRARCTTHAQHTCIVTILVCGTRAGTLDYQTASRFDCEMGSCRAASARL